MGPGRCACKLAPWCQLMSGSDAACNGPGLATGAKAAGPHSHGTALLARAAPGLTAASMTVTSLKLHMWECGWLLPVGLQTLA